MAVIHIELELDAYGQTKYFLNQQKETINIRQRMVRYSLGLRGIEVPMDGGYIWKNVRSVIRFSKKKS